MQSPFPGIDPYLEHPGLWPDVHHRLLSFFAAQLAERLPPAFYATVEQRVYISDPGDPGRDVLAPDVAVVAGPPTEHERRPQSNTITTPVIISEQHYYHSSDNRRMA